MRKTKAISTAALGLLIAAAPAACGYGQNDQRGTSRGGRSPQQLFDRFDRNQDARLAQDEVPPFMWRLLARMDADGDRAITREEMQAARGNGGAGPPFARGGPGGVSRNDGGGFLSRAGLKVGDPLPDALGYDADGNEVQLSDLKGHYSVLVFGCLT